VNGLPFSPIIEITSFGALSKLPGIMEQVHDQEEQDCFWAVIGLEKADLKLPFELQQGRPNGKTFAVGNGDVAATLRAERNGR
jgi:hypothetical protein